MCRWRSVSVEEREKRWPEEHDEQRRQDAEAQREQHDHRQPPGARLGVVTLRLADRVGLQHQETRERRAEAHGCPDERRDARFIGPYRERSERIGERHAKREVREQLARPDVTGGYGRSPDESSYGGFEGGAGVET